MYSKTSINCCFVGFQGQQYSYVYISTVLNVHTTHSNTALLCQSECLANKITEVFIVYHVMKNKDRQTFYSTYTYTLSYKMVYNTMHMIQVIQINRTNNKGKQGLGREREREREREKKKETQ